VPADAPSPADAVASAEPGDLILLAAATYRGALVVPESKPGITIRGEDRNGVVFDGRDVVGSAITVRADGVTLENLTAHDFRGDAIVWDSVRGFTGRFLTVYRSGGYGLYAIGSTGGRLDHDLSSGAANAAFYIGECDPCHTELTGVTATLSGLGYSGTNASGDLVVRDSLFDRNGTGILPNSFDEEADPPQARATFERNVVRGSGSVPTPASDPLDGFGGLGIGLAGGQHDVVRGNRVVGSARYGIALFPTLQRGGRLWRPLGNRVTGNQVTGSGVADLAQSAGSSRGNCFAHNRVATSLPAAIERLLPCGAATTPALGDARVARDLAVPAPTAFAGSGPHPSYTAMPAPGPQPGLPPTAAPASPEAGMLLAALAGALAPRRRRSPRAGRSPTGGADPPRGTGRHPEPWGAREAARPPLRRGAPRRS
jgi:Right handed beta helix region